MPNQPPIVTWHDAIEHLRGWIHGAGDEYNENAIFSATRRAYDELCAECNWGYLWTTKWVNLEAKYATGTITYDHTGGAYERMVTLASGTWPTNAVYGQLRIANVNYKVSTRESSTIITLTTDSNPGADVAAGTSYSWFRTEYTLPADFRKLCHPHLVNYGHLTYVEPEEIYARERRNMGFGQPFLYTLVGDSNVYGSHAIVVHPPATTAETCAFMMQRWPRQLKVSGLADADSSAANGITASTSGTTVTASSAIFDSAKHVGCLLRFGDATNIPTGFEGRYPPVDERVIQSVTSTTVCVVDASMSTLSAVKFRISDPIDIDHGMFNAYFRCCEKQLSARQRDGKYYALADSLYQQELLKALATDSRQTSYSVSGEGYDIGMPVGGMAPIERRLGF